MNWLKKIWFGYKKYNSIEELPEGFENQFKLDLVNSPTFYRYGKTVYVYVFPKITDPDWIRKDGEWQRIDTYEKGYYCLTTDTRPR